MYTADQMYSSVPSKVLHAQTVTDIKTIANISTNHSKRHPHRRHSFD